MTANNCNGCSTVPPSSIPPVAAITRSSSWWPSGYDWGRLQLDDLDWCATDRIARQCIPRGRGAAARQCRRGVERLPVPDPLKRTVSRDVHVRPYSSVWDIKTSLFAADDTFVIRPTGATLWAIIR
jgi:hypothetical protein